MEDHRIRRLPVIEARRLVGMISEADVARNLPDESVAEFVETICASSSLCGRWLSYVPPPG